MAEPVKKVLFVCTANVCRSPMAAAIFNALAEDTALSARAESVGVAALSGEPLSPNAETALQEIGVSGGDHRARQADRTVLEEADLVLTMGPRHTAELHRQLGDPFSEVYTLAEYAGDTPSDEEIPDPYGKPMIAYRASVQQLLGLVSSVVGRLRR